MCKFWFDVLRLSTGKFDVEHHSHLIVSLYYALQLKYFAAIKGEALHLGEDAFDQNKQTNKSTAERAEELLQELHLVDVADLQAMELSTSAKRKLSLAIAMIGDPQVIPVYPRRAN